MKKLSMLLVITAMMFSSACSHEKTNDIVLVKGGAFVNAKSSYYGKDIIIPSFYIGKYEITQKEWMDIMENNPSQFKGDNLPVERVSWYEAIVYCNRRSIKEGLAEYYNIDKNKRDSDNHNDNDNVKWIVTINEGANGYRLPTQPEWEYAASGGRKSKGYTYSGSDNADEVCWYWRNAGDNYLEGDWNWAAIENNNNQTRVTGMKKSNELGLYDMSGNVREWCWEWYEGLDNSAISVRVCKGGGWIGDIASSEISFQGKFDANGEGPDQGFRVCRNE